MKIYLYDREKDTYGQEDSLGNSDDGMRLIGKRLQIVAVDDEGNRFAISVDRNRDGIEIRNEGRRASSGLAVIPQVSNVVTVIAH